MTSGHFKKSVKEIILVNSFSSAFGLAVGCCALPGPFTPSLLPNSKTVLLELPDTQMDTEHPWIQDAGRSQATFSFLSMLPTDVPELNWSLYDQPSISLPQIPWEPGMSDRDTPRAEHRLTPQTVQCIWPQTEPGACVEHPDQDVHLPTMALYKYKLGLQPELKRSRKRYCGVWKFVRYQISLGRWTEREGESPLQAKCSKAITPSCLMQAVLCN